MKVMVSYFVSDTHKVTNTLILVLHLGSCCKFGFAGTDRIFTFKALLWSLLCNLTDMLEALCCALLLSAYSNLWHLSQFKDVTCCLSECIADMMSRNFTR
jgi:hypothetical protein